MTKETSRIDYVKIHSNYMGNKPKRPVTMKIQQPSKLVITIKHFQHRYNNKRQENRLQRKALRPKQPVVTTVKLPHKRKKRVETK